ncbi:MAG: 3-isopropylmalate dehydratase large subunit [Myxococcota bacterium]
MRATLFEKIWREHVVRHEGGFPAVLYIDLHLIHEVTSPQAFTLLGARNLPVLRPRQVVATMDHSTPTLPKSLVVVDAQGQAQLEQLRINCEAHGILLYDQESDRNGIVHVIGPELGLTQPGMTIVCGDSHTATHGAFGALAFGIGTSEVGHVLATQCLLQRRPKTLAVELDGVLAPGVTAKDVILGLIAKIGVDGARGHVIEYRGSAVSAMSMEERMTLCNMSIEAGGRAGMVAPDDTTIDYIAGRAFAPQEAAWEAAVTRWRGLVSDEGAAFDKTVRFDVSSLAPMITYGTTPAMAIGVDGSIPELTALGDAERAAVEKSLRYMNLSPGSPILGQKVDVVFIGSCTNSRLSDLRAAASVFKGRKVSAGTQALVVPGSAEVRRQAEAEGLDQIFLEAGAEWRRPGCSMCLGMNGDQLKPGQYAVSTSNRNFEGRQGYGGRTFLASPLTAAASAVEGKVADARQFVERG